MGVEGELKLTINFHCLLMQKNPKLKYPIFSKKYSVNVTDSSTDPQNLSLSKCRGQIHNRRGWQ